jgi:tetratricopeptide (TPR) repeat protein
MKFSASVLLLASFVTLADLANAQIPKATPAEQRIAAAQKQIDADGKSSQAYSNLALALIARSRETASPAYDLQATNAIAKGLANAPNDFQLRKARVALLLDQHNFEQARDEAKDLSSHKPDDARLRGYLAEAYIGLGDYKAAEDSAHWMLIFLPQNIPGLRIAAEIRDHDGDHAGALELLQRALDETSPSEIGELAAIANQMASVEMETAKRDDASASLRAADEAFPGYPETAKSRERLHLNASSLVSPQPAGPQSSTAAPGISEPAQTPMPATITKVNFSPVPASLLIPQSTGSERILRNAQSRAQANAGDPASFAALGAAFFQRARETGDVEDFQLAEQALQKSLALQSTDFSADAAWSGLAEVCMGEHRFSDAIGYAQQALALGSGDLSSFAIVGDANADMGEYDHAAAAYTRLNLSGSSPSDPRTVYVRDSRTSYLKFISGDTAGAILLMQSAVEAGATANLPAENLAWLYFELGEYAWQAGEIALADNAYLTALTIHPGDYRALAGLGKLRGNQGRFAEAIKLYQSAIAVVPMPIFVAELGDLYARSGNSAEAKKQYQLVEYIGLLGHINQVLHNRDLALFYADHDIKLGEALTLAQKEFEVRHDVYTWDALAWAFYKNGKYPEATEAIAHALRPGTRDAMLLFHAGMIAAGMRQSQLAKDRLQQALEINPQFHVIYADVARQQLKALSTQPALTASKEPAHVP